MKILITAGATQEKIDSVRYITNFSSGKMGYALALNAYKRGHRVTVIAGTFNIEMPKGVKVESVKTALDMKRAVSKHIKKSDCLIMAAAVSDYRPAKQFKGKIKKSKKAIHIKLIPNPDILKEIGAKTRNKVLVGFALESDSLLKNAFAKLKRKKLDYIIANSVNALGADKTDVTILGKDGVIKKFKKTSKSQIAGYIIHLIEK